MRSFLVFVLTAVAALACGALSAWVSMDSVTYVDDWAVDTSPASDVRVVTIRRIGPGTYELRALTKAETGCRLGAAAARTLSAGSPRVVGSGS